MPYLTVHLRGQNDWTLREAESAVKQTRDLLQRTTALTIEPVRSANQKHCEQYWAGRTPADDEPSILRDMRPIIDAYHGKGKDALRIVECTGFSFTAPGMYWPTTLGLARTSEDGEERKAPNDNSPWFLPSCMVPTGKMPHVSDVGGTAAMLFSHFGTVYAMHRINRIDGMQVWVKDPSGFGDLGYPELGSYNLSSVADWVACPLDGVSDLVAEHMGSSNRMLAHKVLNGTCPVPMEDDADFMASLLGSLKEIAKARKADAFLPRG